MNTLRRYEPSWLRHDIVAGLVMTTMLVPVGIAYAQASGVPGINGLYATIVPLLAYALFGPSRIIVLGPDSALAAVILAVVLPLSAEPQRAVAVAGHVWGQSIRPAAFSSNRRDAGQAIPAIHSWSPDPWIDETELIERVFRPAELTWPARGH